MSSIADKNLRPPFDKVMVDIAHYVKHYTINSPLAYETALYCLMDSLGCAILALNFPDCTKLLGPVVPGTIVPQGARVPGTHLSLDPVLASFQIGLLIRWLDFNDTWLAAEWGHPSDNLGPILAVADYLSQVRMKEGQPPLTLREVLTALIKAQEIQGVLALDNSFNQRGLDHVILVKIASVAVVTDLLGGDEDAILNALSLAWVDGQSLRTYRHAPNTGSRKSWAAGDAGARAVQLAFLALRGEMGYPSALTAPRWGFYDVSFGGKTFSFQRPYGAYVMENILFKIAFPAEFHAQTAVEAALMLHPSVVNRLEDIESILLETQVAGATIISKIGPLYNPADRDHCLQYMVAIGLIWGDLRAEHYEDEIAQDPRIDSLREKMQVIENPKFTQAYHDPERRAIPNAIQITFKQGDQCQRIQVDYPLGHVRRREEGIPRLIEKCRRNLETHFTRQKTEQLMTTFSQEDCLSLPVHQWMENWLGY